MCITKKKTACVAYIWGCRLSKVTTLNKTAGTTYWGYFEYAKKIPDNVWFHRYFRPCSTHNLIEVSNQWNWGHNTLQSVQDITLETIPAITGIKASVQQDSKTLQMLIEDANEKICLYKTKTT